MKHLYKMLWLLAIAWGMTAPLQAQQVIFEDDFESQTLKPQWTARPNLEGENGVVRLFADVDRGGSQILMMGKESDGGEVVNAIDLNLDLSLYSDTDIEFSFTYMDWEDDTNFEDGIFLSDDGGNTFVRVIALEPQRWENFRYSSFPKFDLDEIIRNMNLSFTSTFVIRFQQKAVRDFSGFGGRDGLFFDNILVSVPQPTVYKTLPYLQNFESGTLDNEWKTTTSYVDDNGIILESTSPDGIVYLDENQGRGSGYALGLGKTIDGNGEHINYADLHLDLSSYSESQLEFGFWWQHFEEDSDFQDGIFFSDDGGNTFIRAIALQPQKWRQFLYGSFPTFDLDELIKKYELSFSNNFVIRFQQKAIRDFGGFNGRDGLFFDDISIKVAEPVTYQTLPFSDDFEGEALRSSWKVRSTQVDNNGLPDEGFTPSYLVELSPQNGVASSAALAMGKANDNNGENINALDLHLNLEGQENVLLNFTLRPFNDETQARDAVYFSNDGGSNFTRIFALDPNNLTNDQYNDISFNLAELARQEGITPSATSVVRIQQVGTGDFSRSGDEDGFFVDNVFVSAIPTPSIADFEPKSGDFGTTVTITGTNFDSLSAVLFNGLSAAFNIVSSTEVQAIVPFGASSGKVGVQIPGKVVESTTSFNVTTSPIPDAPQNLTATATSTSQISLAWGDNSGSEIGFRVYRSDSQNGTFIEIASLGVNTTTYQDIDLPPATTHFYRVTAFNVQGESAFSNTAEATTEDKITALDEYNLSNTLTAYPNPVENQLRIELENEHTGDLVVELLTVTGQVVEQFSTQKQGLNFQHTFELGELSQGMYLLKVQQGKYWAVKRVVK